MMQYEILKYMYAQFSQLIADAGKENDLYSVETGSYPEHIEKVIVHAAVTDVCQFACDKTGQRIIIDEKRYELPARIAVSLSLIITGSEYDSILEAAGCIIRTLKDNAVLKAGEYNWHGNDDGSMYIESVVRNPQAGKSGLVNGYPSIVLDYRIEAGINSAKGEEFTRVDKRDIRSDMMK